MDYRRTLCHLCEEIFPLFFGESEFLGWLVNENSVLLSLPSLGIRKIVVTFWPHLTESGIEVFLNTEGNVATKTICMVKKIERFFIYTSDEESQRKKTEQLKQ